jgi:antitoxin MazE
LCGKYARILDCLLHDNRGGCFILRQSALVGDKYATLRTSPSSGQATTNTLLSHPRHPACLTGAALERWGPDSCSQELVYSLYSRWVAVQTRVQKWGNSLGVRIPRGLAEEVGLGAGSEVSLSAKDGELVVKPSVPARLRLDDLLAEVSEENLHSSIDTGSAVGAENFC